MRQLLLALILVASCNHDSFEDKQAYELMTHQFEQWADTAARGGKLVPGFGVIAERHCFEARRDQASIEAARPLAKACEASLEKIKAAAVK